MEEVGLPMDKERVRFLTKLAPTVGRAGLLITPIVAVVLDHSIQVSNRDRHHSVRLGYSQL